jgi:hypothetical protein
LVWPLSLLSELTRCSQGWKLGDMMFVTKRGLSDACNVVGKQVDQVSDSVNVSFFRPFTALETFAFHSKGIGPMVKLHHNKS